MLYVMFSASSREWSFLLIKRTLNINNTIYLSCSKSLSEKGLRIPGMSATCLVIGQNQNLFHQNQEIRIWCMPNSWWCHGFIIYINISKYIYVEMAT